MGSSEEPPLAMTVRNGTQNRLGVQQGGGGAGPLDLRNELVAGYS